MYERMACAVVSGSYIRLLICDFTFSRYRSIRCSISSKLCSYQMKFIAVINNIPQFIVSKFNYMYNRNTVNTLFYNCTNGAFLKSFRVVQSRALLN